MYRHIECKMYMYIQNSTCMLCGLSVSDSPRSLFLFHVCSWLCNVFGLFFILAAHEHYSIDVFIAFYLTSRLFLYYHSLANNSALRQQDGVRTRVWFPLFSFFEAKADRIVPNEYEMPLPCPQFCRTLLGLTSERKKVN